MLSGFLVFFGVLALGISCLGVYGILGYIVSLRTPELGIRMALGAQRFAVIRMVVAESVAPVALGMGIGLTTALMLTRWVESILFGVSTQDPWTIAGAAALLLLTAAAAAFVPARRAALTDPMAALRYE
jgi:ABC-type antimicrobial peptide transport system permease subunit